MQLTSRFVLLLAAVVLVGCADKTSDVSDRSDKSDDLYFVGTYDPNVDPADDVQRAVDLATQQNKRILLQVGGDWCGWCHKMSDFFHENGQVVTALRDGFVLVKINKSDENSNEEFLKQYPEIEGYPHLFVLEHDGTLLHSQDTVELEEGDSYSLDAVVGFLAEWAVPG